MCCMTSLPVTAVLSCAVNQGHPFPANVLGPSPRDQTEVSACVKCSESQKSPLWSFSDFISIVLVTGQKWAVGLRRKVKQMLWWKRFGFFCFHFNQGHALQRIIVGSHQKLHERQRQPAAIHFQCMLMMKGVWRLGCREQRNGSDLSNHGC